MLVMLVNQLDYRSYSVFLLCRSSLLTSFFMLVNKLIMLVRLVMLGEQFSLYGYTVKHLILLVLQVKHLGQTG